MRLCYLYLRSRLSGWAVGSIAVIGVISWLWLRQAHEIGMMEAALIIAPLLPAAIIGTSVRSPFGDTEHSVSYPLSRLRLGHLVGLLLCGTLALGLSTYGWNGDPIGWEFIRNMAGYTGLALIGARLLGSAICWVVPLGYGVISLLLAPTSRWAWVNDIPADRWSISIAVVLLVVGLIPVAFGQARQAADDAV